MDEEYRSLVEHGNLVTTVHCRQKVMFTKRDFSTLLDSEGIEDICVKLQHHYPEVVEMKKFTRGELRRKLNETLLREIKQSLREPSAAEQINFFVESYKIQNFFFLLSCKEYDAELEHSFEKIEALGYFNELDTLKFCASMEEVYLYCIKNTFLANYCSQSMFKKDFQENDFSAASTEVRKRHIERYARSARGQFLKLLRLEGDKHNLDIVLSTLNSEISSQKKLCWMTFVTNFTHSEYRSLAETADIGELQSILGKTRTYRTFCDELKDKDMSSVFLRREVDAYMSTFDTFNDITSLYAYLKLKEQEIKNILCVAECVIQGRRNILDELMVPVP